MALAAPALVGECGPSAETGYWFYLEKSAQKAADVVAHAGAVALHKGSSVQWAIEKAARTAMITPTIDQEKFQELVDGNLADMGVEADVSVAYSKETGSEVALARAQATYVHTVRPIFLPSFDVSFESDVSFPLAT
jgi:Flp pilus assembly protein TadG